MRAFAVRGLLVLLTSYGNTYASRMKSIPVTRARKDLYRLLDEVTEECEPADHRPPFQRGAGLGV